MHDKDDIIRMDDHRPQPQEPRPAPRRDWGKVFAGDSDTKLKRCCDAYDAAIAKVRE